MAAGAYQRPTERRSSSTSSTAAVASAPGEHHPEVLDLTREHAPRRLGPGDVGDHTLLPHPEDPSELEQPSSRAAMTFVVGHRLDQPGQQRGAQDRLLGGQGVGEHQPVGSQAAALQIARREERHRHRLVHAEAHQRPAQRPPVLLALAQLAGVG